MIRTSWTEPVMIVSAGSGKYAYPERFLAWVEGEGPFVADLEFRVIDGSVRCVSLCVHAPEGEYLRGAEVRDRVALTRWTKLAIEDVAMEPGDGPSFGWPLSRIDRREIGVAAGRERRMMDDPSRLERVAEEHARAIEAGLAPVQAVSHKLHYSPAHAQRLVNQARAAGLIPKAPRKRKK